MYDSWLEKRKGIGKTKGFEIVELILMVAYGENGTMTL